MASGFGAFGGVGRCYPIWRDLVKCVKANPVGLECVEFRDDYVECLHHSKEFERANIVEERKNQLIKEGKYTPPAPLERNIF